LDHAKDKDPGLAASVGLHLHPLFTTASPKGPAYSVCLLPNSDQGEGARSTSLFADAQLRAIN